MTRSAALLLLAALVGLAGPAGAQQAGGMPSPVVVPPGPGGVRVTAQGLVANWYAPPAGPPVAPAVLLLGGSEGGIGPGAARQAADLVAHGFAVLQLAYFGAPGLPAYLRGIPLEYFDTAIGWVRAQPGIDPRRIAVVGSSKGAEAALVIATRHPELAAVVAGAPSAVIWPGIEPGAADPGSSWTSGGVAVPALPYGAGGTTIFDLYRIGLAAFPAHPQAAIQVGRIAARVLLVCGRADRLWPSCPMAQLVADRVGRRATLLAYDDAGHAVFGPPLADDSPALPTLGSLGGTPEGNNRARHDAWPRVIAFLQAMGPR